MISMYQQFFIDMKIMTLHKKCLETRHSKEEVIKKCFELRSNLEEEYPALPKLKQRR